MKDKFGRDITTDSKNGTDTYTVSQAGIKCFAVGFPTGTPVSQILGSIESMVTGVPQESPPQLDATIQAAIDNAVAASEVDVLAAVDAKVADAVAAVSVDVAVPAKGVVGG